MDMNVPVIMKVRDDVDNEKFEGIHENLPQMPSLVLIIGSVRTGKSNLLVNLFCNPAFYKDRFNIVRIVSTTLHSDTKGKILDKFFDCSDHYEDSIINDIKKSQGAYKDKSERPTYALVLDDVLTKDFSKSNEVSFFSTRFRHYIDMYVIATQTFRAVSGLISEEYSGLVGGEENFMKLYNDVHSEQYQLMYIKGSVNPAQVFKNFEVQIY